MKFNLNTATQSQLETIKGIGPVLAARILWWQQRHGFTKLVDLMQVKGVKASVFAEAKAQGVYVMDPEDEMRTKAMEDLSLACQLKSALIEKHPNVAIVSDYGNILIYVNVNERQAREIKDMAESFLSNTDGVNNIEVHAGVSPPDNAV